MFGLELLSGPSLLIAEWIIIFIVNVIPAFMPPTWALLSAFYIAQPQDIFILIIIGVTASTCGRFALAKLSEKVTSKFASKKKKDEFNAIGNKLQGKAIQKFIFTLIYALSPLPSNALFIAFGATKTRLREVLAGFFIGRSLSYLFLVLTTNQIFSSVEKTLAGNASLWTIMIEVIGVVVVVGFFFVDWNKIILLGMPDNPKDASKENKK
jgi:membrane protein YqaA with SNARE-associated domain